MTTISLVLTLIPIGITALSLIFIYLFVFTPYHLLSFYKKQGIQTRFIPIFGRVSQRMKDLKEKGDFMAECKESSRVNPGQKMIAFNIGNNVMLALRDTEYMKEFLHNPSKYKKAKYFGAIHKFLGNGLLFVEADQWKLRRKLISSCFHYEFITNNAQLIQETAREFLDNIPETEYKNCLIMDKLQGITGEVVGRIFFGRNLNRYTFEGKQLTTALAEIMMDLGEFVRTPLYMILNTKAMMLPFPKIKKLVQQIRDFRAQCFTIIQDRKRDNQRYNDLLDALLVQQKQESAPDQRLTDEDITNEFITFFMAGMDTTGHLATMTLYNLAQHPEYIVKLQEERERTYNLSKEVTIDAIQSMDMLNCFIKETLRHHLPAPTVFPRETVEDLKLKDIYIKKGTLVRTDPFSLFFNREYFEEPEKFNPDRWLNPSPKMDSFAFIPFSAGPRNCIGQHLAMLESKIIVSEFLERFDFKISEGYKLGMIFRFLYEPVDNMRMDLTRK